MPIYEYRCSSCGFQKEYLRKVSDPLLHVCPECGKETFGKMLTAAGFQLKGGGWYATDFKHSGSKPESKTGTASVGKSNNDSNNDSKGDRKSDSKTEAQPAAAPAAPAAAASAAKAE